MRRLAYWLIAVGVLELILSTSQLAVLASGKAIRNAVAYEVLPGILIGIDKNGVRLCACSGITGFLTNNAWLFALTGLITSLILFIYIKRNEFITADTPLIRVPMMTLTTIALILSMPLPLLVGDGIVVFANIYKGFASILYALTTLVAFGHICLMRKKREVQIEDLIYETWHGG